MPPSRLRPAYLLVALTLALLGGAGLLYYFKPIPVHAITWAPQERLPYEKESVESNDMVTKNPDRKITQPNETTAANEKAIEELPFVEITGPVTGATFEQPASITITANVVSGKDPIRKVEFFYRSSWRFHQSICNSSADELLRSDSITKIGEAIGSPWQVSWDGGIADDYFLLAIVTDEAGRLQVSSPKLIIVKANDQRTLVGWEPGIDRAEPLPFHEEPRLPRNLCPKLSLTRHAEVRTEGLPLTFEAKLSPRSDYSATTFQWSVSAGRIISGQGTKAIVVDTTGLAGQGVTAIVESKGPNEECSDKDSDTIRILKSREFGALNNVDIDREKERLDAFARELRLPPPQLRPRQRRRATNTLARKPNPTRSTLDKLHFITAPIPTAEVPAETTGAPLQPTPTPPNTTTAPLETITSPIETIQFREAAPPQSKPKTSRGRIFFYNGSSACEGEGLLLAKWARRYLVGRLHIPSKWVTLENGGYAEDTYLQLEDRNGIRLTLHPRRVESGAVHTRQCSMDALADLLDREFDTQTNLYRGCPDVTENISFDASLLAQSPREFDSKYRFREFATREQTVNTCSVNPRDPQNSGTKVRLSTSVGGVFGKKLAHKYTANGGHVVGSGEEVIWDLSGAGPGLYTAVVEVDGGCSCTGLATASVLVTGYCTPCVTVSKSEDESNNLKFKADIANFVRQRNLRYRWRVSAGTVTTGQDTPTLTVDTSNLRREQEVVAAVEVEGLPEFCNRTASYKAYVRAERISAQQNSTTLSAVVTSSRQAATHSDHTTLLPQPQTQPSPRTGVLESSDQEWIAIGWQPTVNLGEDVSIGVKYDRTTDTFEVRDSNGLVRQRLFVLKSLREKWGPEYEIQAQVKLLSVDLGCSEWCSDSYKSLDLQPHIEWGFSKKPNREGVIDFHLELFVRGRPKGSLTPIDELSVWQKTGMKIEVKNPPIVKSAIMPPSILILLLAVAFAVKGVRVTYVKGDLVGRDKAGGDIVHGDKVGRDKSTIITHEQSVNEAHGVEVVKNDEHAREEK